MICTVGNVCQQQISVENPFNETITLVKDENIMFSSTEPSAQNCFFLKKKKSSVTIPASCVHPVTLVYRPSLIGIKQSCDIILKHKKLGEWNYNVMGLGKEPNIEKHTFIYAALHSRISKVISFHNPFDQMLKIKIDLEYSNPDDGRHKIFQLFMKRKKGVDTVNVSPNSSLQLPIFFAPNSMRKHTANLVISTKIHREDSGNKKGISERELVWTYPIIGLAEYKSSQLLSIRCNARESFHKIWTVELDNYDVASHQEDEFTIEVERTPAAD